MSKYRLSSMEFDEVSFVVGGDDPMAEVVIAKAEKNNTTDETGATVRSMSDPTTAQGDEMSDTQTEKAEIKLDDLPEEVVAYIAELEAIAEEVLADDDTADTEDELATVGKSDEVDLSKVDPAVRSLIEKAQARADEAEALAKAERDIRTKAEMIAKAEALPMIADDRESLAELLKSLGEQAPELAPKVEALFAAANDAIAKGNLFAEFGKSGASTTVSTSVEAKAAEYRSADPTLSPEQAIAKVYTENPDLYDLALKEG